ncbi:MAG: hypothetical protein AAGA16_13345 [Cyanobacteria bacterium P01_E01_bin.35]
MKLPLEYRWLKANGFNGFVPWYLIESLDRETLRKEYRQETNKDFYPFARRQDSDDVAGFKIKNGKITSTVVSVHLTWTGRREQKGFPRKNEYKNMFEWLKQEVIPDTLEWMSEEELQKD